MTALFMNVWHSPSTGNQWTDADFGPQDRDFCDRVAADIASKPCGIKRIGVLRITAKPTPPALSEAEMAQLVAEDEAAERRQEAWERAKRIAAAFAVMVIGIPALNLMDAIIRGLA